MKLIPYFPCEKISDKPSDEVIQIFKTNIAADSYSLLTYKNYTFTIQRNINYRNSFLPIAFGRITETSEKISVNIFIRMHWVIIIFLFIWFTFLIIALVVLLLYSAPLAFIMGVIASITFGYIVVEVGFWFEAKKLISIFNEIFSII